MNYVKKILFIFISIITDYNKKKYINKCKKKKVIKVIFFVIHHSVWKYEVLYKLLSSNIRFDVKIAVVPLINNGIYDLENYNKSYRYFKDQNYNLLETYDSNSREWIDVKKTYNPDIIFFTNPHNLTLRKYYITNFINRISCYVPYAFVVIHTTHIHYSGIFFSLLWRYYLETDIHRDYAKSFGLREANLVVTGYPGLDKIFHKYKPRVVWKNRNHSLKRVIWAPHHTIESQGSNLDYSSFKTFAAFFLALANESNKVQLAFKPHPLLKEKLYKDPDWGKQKTDNYFESWKKSSFGQLEDGQYIDLFYTSDAMIMDSASFLAEYQYFGKPLLFTRRDINIEKRFNSVGKILYNFTYKADSVKDILEFINDVVINENDYLKTKRNDNLISLLKNNLKISSLNIYNNLLYELQ